MSRPLSPRGFSSKNDSAAHDPTASQPGSLTASLYRYLSVTLWMLSNDYSGLRWPDGKHESMKLQNEQDMARLSNWANRIYGIQACLMSPAPEKSIRAVLRRCCRNSPTILYLGGHTMEIAGEQVYLPEDCYDTKTKFPIRGISFKDISKALLSSNEDHALLLITDACKFPNVMKLPFVLMVVNGQAYWEKTEFYGRGVVNRRVLHYASTTPDGFSYGSQSVGGFFTSAMCNFALEAELTLPERSMGIQQDMDDYQRKISKPNEGQLAQQHRVYSSEEFDLYDKRIFEKFGFFHNPVASELGGC